MNFKNPLTLVVNLAEDYVVVVSFILMLVGGIWAFSPKFAFFGTNLDSNLVGYFLLIVFGAIFLKRKGIFE